MSAKKKPLFDDNLKIVFYLLLPLLLLPPFFRGLFFPLEADVAHIYTAIVLGVYVILRKDYITMSRNVMDYAWLGLVLAYGIASFGALNPRDSLESTLAVFNFLVIYWLLSQTVRGLQDFKTVLTVMFAAGIGVALAGLGTAFGTFWFNGAYDSGLILSTLQYHNAVAIFLVACSILGFFLTASVDKTWLRILFGGLNYIIVTTAFGAGSRGAMLVAPVGFVLLIAGLPKEYRSKVFLNLLAVLLPFFITAKQVLNFSDNSEGYHWAWLFLGIVVGCGGQYVVERFLSFAAETRKRVVTGIGVAVSILAIGLVLFMGSKIMPTSIANRLSYISLKDVNVLHRFYFYQDALKIIQDYPVFGIGGGGWKAMYPKYQPFLYYSTEVHSHPLQVWVESGTFGLVFYALIWIGLVITLFRIMRKVQSPEYRAVAWTSAVAALSICLHSTIDFSLSLGAVAILMWGLIGLVRGIERIHLEDPKVKTVVGPLARKVTGLVLAGIVLVTSGSLYLAAVKEKEAIAAYNIGDIQGASGYFEEAKKYDPLTYRYPMFLSQLYSNMAYQRGDRALIGTALENAKKAADLNKMAADTLWNLAQSYLMAGMPNEAIATVEESWKSAPWRQDSYNTLARVYLTAGKIYLQDGDKVRARAALEKAVNIPQFIQDQISKIDPRDQGLWIRGPAPQVNDNIKQSVDEAQKLLKGL